MVEGGGSPVTAERVARNEATFREANEGIRAVAAQTELATHDLVPFICECAEIRCTEIVQLSTEEYEAVRDVPTRFLYARGHERSAARWVRVVDEFDRYTLVEKVGEAAAIVAELDPRVAEA